MPQPVGEGASAVCSAWQDILSACTDHRLKIALGKAAVEAEADGITIYAASDMAYKQLKEESAVDYVKELIRNVTGICVDVFISTTDRKPEIANQVDLMSVLGNINITIETEDV